MGPEMGCTEVGQYYEKNWDGLNHKSPTTSNLEPVKSHENTKIMDVNWEKKIFWQL